MSEGYGSSVSNSVVWLIVDFPPAKISKGGNASSKAQSTANRAQRKNSGRPEAVHNLSPVPLGERAVASGNFATWPNGSQAEIKNLLNLYHPEVTIRIR